MTTATASPLSFAAPCARAAALYVVSQMRGLDSWGNNIAKDFFQKNQGEFFSRLTI